MNQLECGYLTYVTTFLVRAVIG